MSACPLPSWIGEPAGCDGPIVLSIHAQPGAKRSEIVGPHGDALKIRIAAPAVDGKANDALLDFVAKRLGLSRKEVTLFSGESSRKKRLGISRLTSAEVMRGLDQSLLPAE